MHIHVADALQMREHRHARLLLHARYERLAAAWHDHVEGAIQTAQHGADGRPVRGGYKLDRIGRQPGRN